MLEEKKIAILGGGSWATAIIKILCGNNSDINWYIRDKKSVEIIKTISRNPKYLRSVKIDHEKINFYTEINECIRSSDIIIICIPSAFLEKALANIKLDLKDKIVFSAVKGIIPDKHLIITEFLNKYHNVPIDSTGVISGPCHAEEVALERLSYLTFFSKDIKKAEFLADLFKCRYIKTLVSNDIYGVEYSTVLKNIAAIASGICFGLGYGDNYLSVLISNALREISQFLDVVHPNKRDINCSAYLGDLIVTAYSQFSRNRSFGTMIGKGYSIRNAKLEMSMVAEGYYSSNSIHEINKKYKLNMPICDAVYNILYKDASAEQEIKSLNEFLS